MEVIIQAVELLTSFRERTRTPKAELKSTLTGKQRLY